jgi:membrane-bound metal-dependent hydrolase YbcI (DUF457 family)
MTGPTHRKFSVAFTFIGAMLIYKYNILDISYYLVVMVMLMTARHGALFPDLDHSWKNVGNKTVVNKIVNSLIHLTGGKHRSWQTHSIDICMWFTIISFILPDITYRYDIISYLNSQVLKLIMIGFSTGWISHEFSDMLTSGGLRLFFFNNKIKLKLVPKRIKIFRKELRFNTGNEWEAFCYKWTNRINKVLGVICIIYPFMHELIK